MKKPFTKQSLSKCPSCGKMAFEKGSVVVGAEEGGPLRFEFDSRYKVKVRSSACHACGHISFKINTEEWNKIRFKQIREAVISEAGKLWRRGGMLIPLGKLKARLKMPEATRDEAIVEFVKHEDGRLEFDDTTMLMELDTENDCLRLQWSEKVGYTTDEK